MIREAINLSCRILLRNRDTVWGVIIAAAVTCGATAQTSNVDERLMQGQRMRASGHSVEARTIFVNLLRDIKNYPADDRREASILDDLGITDLGSGNYAEAETAFNRALSTLHPRGEDDPILALVKTHLGELYLTEQRPADAEPLLRQAAASRLRAERPDAVTLSSIYDNLAMVCVMQGKRQEGETLVRKALAIVETELGPNDPALSGSLLIYVGLLMNEHHYADAVAPAERAWQILHDHLSNAAPGYLAGASSVLSLVYSHTSRTAEAEAFARQAVDMGESAYGPDSSVVGLYLTNYAAILKHENRKKEAREIQHRADAILAKEGPAGNVGGYTINVNALR
jgi:tetratricopeptide (TPR) repeat protein